MFWSHILKHFSLPAITARFAVSCEAWLFLSLASPPQTSQWPVNSCKIDQSVTQFLGWRRVCLLQKSPQSVFSRQVLNPLLETFSIWQTANRKPQLRVCCFALPRFQTLARRSVQFSSFLFSQNIIQYKNTYRNCKVAREPRRNQKAYEAWTPQSQRNKQNKMKFAEWYVKNRN